VPRLPCSAGTAAAVVVAVVSYDTTAARKVAENVPGPLLVALTLITSY
jgi:hypothetical protein